MTRRAWLAPLAFLTSAIAFTPAAIAAEPAAAASTGARPAASSVAMTLVDLLDVERVMDTMFGQMKGLFADNVIAALQRDPAQGGHLTNLFAEGRGGREKFSTILGDEFVTALRAQYPDLKAAAAAEYTRIYTPGELNELVAFFSSGVGAKWRTQSPQVEKAMGAWGERAGMEAGGIALTNALKRADVEMLGKGNSQ